MFITCSSLTSVPSLVTSAGTLFIEMFRNCTAFSTVPLLDTSLGTDFTAMFDNCSALTTVPLLDTSAGTTFVHMFQRCPVLLTVPALDVSLGTNFLDMFTFDYALADIQATGFTYSVSVANTQLAAANLNSFFTNLGTASGAQTVDITNCPGAATCDRTIAEAKGWTVIG
jgi:hypothetical protein